MNNNRIELKRGDYVSTEGMTEEQYHAVARAFMAAGADGSKGDFYHLKNDVSYLGWDKRDDELWDCGHKSLGFTGGHLTIDQVLGATNAKPRLTRIVETGLTARDLMQTADPITTLKQARQARDEAEQAYQEALVGAREYLGEGFELTEVGTDGPMVDGEDMTDPANWREGDVFECKKDTIFLTEGKHYPLVVDPKDGLLEIRDDTGDLCRTASMVRRGIFKFHHRPA